MAEGVSSSQERPHFAVLRNKDFRRLWLVTSVASAGDWLSIIAMTALSTALVDDYRTGAFALGGILLVRLAPSLLMAPIGGMLADRFDRRKIMVIADLLRFGLFLSVPVVGSIWWLFAAVFLIELCSMAWIPAKDAAVPDLLDGPRQVEVAQQLSLAMTYGVSVLLAAGLMSAVRPVAGLLGYDLDPTATVSVALTINGSAYLLTAATAAFGIRGLSRSGRPADPDRETPGFVGLLTEGLALVRARPLLRGLFVGITAAFTAAGAVIASGTLYAQSLGGGPSAYSILFGSLFAGVALGMLLAPAWAARRDRRTIFGNAIVLSGIGLLLASVAWHLTLAVAAILFVGTAAGIAFLTGQTVIATETPTEVRGRVVAFVQATVRLVLLGSSGLMPFLIGFIGRPVITVSGHTAEIDGTRILLCGAGALAIGLGLLSGRQMRRAADAARV
jgi:dTMP kinase